MLELERAGGSHPTGVGLGVGQGPAGVWLGPRLGQVWVIPVKGHWAEVGCSSWTTSGVLQNNEASVFVTTLVFDQSHVSLNKLRTRAAASELDTGGTLCTPIEGERIPINPHARAGLGC